MEGALDAICHPSIPGGSSRGGRESGRDRKKTEPKRKSELLTKSRGSFREKGRTNAFVDGSQAGSKRRDLSGTVIE